MHLCDRALCNSPVCPTHVYTRVHADTIFTPRCADCTASEDGRTLGLLGKARALLGAFPAAYWQVCPVHAAAALLMGLGLCCKLCDLKKERACMRCSLAQAIGILALLLP